VVSAGKDKVVARRSKSRHTHRANKQTILTMSCCAAMCGQVRSRALSAGHNVVVLEPCRWQVRGQCSHRKAHAAGMGPRTHQEMYARLMNTVDSSLVVLYK